MRNEENSYAHCKRKYPAAERNKAFILEILKKYIPLVGQVKMLEIASGSGQHAAFFAKNLPNLSVQPSELNSTDLPSIKGYAEEVSNMKQPICIDVRQGPWPVEDEYDFILNVNMFHISEFQCSLDFFKHGSQVLKNGGLIFTYGPYAIDGKLEPQSNIDFDQNLKAQNPLWGIRDVEDLKKVASKYDIFLKAVHNLPANNKCIVWVKNANK